MIIQVFEGYWGTGRLGHSLALLRIRHHRLRAYVLRDIVDRHERREANGTLRPDQEMSSAVRAAEADRQAQGYPENLDEVLPTRLGNVLRRHESLAGAPYKLAAIPAIPRLAMVAQAPENNYLENQRTQLELAIRISALAAVAAVVTSVFMFRHGLWLLLVSAPYGVTFMAYRGAVALAAEYGLAFTVLLDLNWFAL